MLKISQAFYDASLDRYAKANVIFRLTTGYGVYLFSDTALDAVSLVLGGPYYADGSWLADGTVSGGGTMLGYGDLVQTFGSLRDSLVPANGSLLSELSSSEPGSITLTLTDRDGKISEIEARQNLLGAMGEILVGWPGLSTYDYLVRFKGRVELAQMDTPTGTVTLTLNALGESSPSLTDIYELPKASRYTSPRNEGDLLRIPYGDLTTGGSDGIWEAPCIDTVNRIYALAGCAVLSVANGNSVTVYNGDDEQMGSGFTFSESNDYELQGVIATITFPSVSGSDISFAASDGSINSASSAFSINWTNWQIVVTGSSDNDGTYKVVSATAAKLILEGRTVKDESVGASITVACDQERNEPLTVRAKGRSSGATLIENPVGIAEDFLTLVGWDSDAIHSTAMERARVLCAGQSYVAAGVVEDDRSIGESLTEILACFRCGWWPDASGKIIFSVDVGFGSMRESDCVGFLRAHETGQSSVSQDLQNLCNQASAKYAYNWQKGIFEAEDDGAATKDANSISVYGQQTRAFECKWIRSATVVATLQQTLIGQRADRTRLISLPLDSLKHVPVERGDYLFYSNRTIKDADGYPLANQIVRVMEFSPNLDQQSINLSLLDTGSYKTLALLADGTTTADGSAASGQRDRGEY